MLKLHSVHFPERAETVTVESIADALVALRRLARRRNFKWPEILRLANQQFMDEVAEERTDGT